MESAPILEHDPAREAVLEPADAVPRKNVVPAGIPERCVLCFFHDAIAALVADGTLTRMTELRTEMSPQPVYELEESGQRLTLVHPGLGAPMAAAFMEEMIALGCRRFIACGGAGVLRSDIAVGHLVVPPAAVRDEGTSYHYYPPSREMTPAPAAVDAIRSVLDANRNRQSERIQGAGGADAPAERAAHAEAHGAGRGRHPGGADRFAGSGVRGSQGALGDVHGWLTSRFCGPTQPDSTSSGSRIVYRHDTDRVHVTAVLDARRDLSSLLLERLVR